MTEKLNTERKPFKGKSFLEAKQVLEDYEKTIEDHVNVYAINIGLKEIGGYNQWTINVFTTYNLRRKRINALNKTIKGIPIFYEHCEDPNNPSKKMAVKS